MKHSTGEAKANAHIRRWVGGGWCVCGVRVGGGGVGGSASAFRSLSSPGAPSGSTRPASFTRRGFQILIVYYISSFSAECRVDTTVDSSSVFGDFAPHFCCNRAAIQLMAIFKCFVYSLASSPSLFCHLFRSWQTQCFERQDTSTNKFGKNFGSFSPTSWYDIFLYLRIPS